jgi:hypothetical protein
MSVGQLQSIRYAVLNFLQDVKVLVSIFVSRGQQYPDGSFKHTPPNHFYKGKFLEVPWLLQVNFSAIFL